MNKSISFLAAVIISFACFAQSDLATFNLKAGVTKCSGTMYDNANPGVGTELTFDKQGSLLTIGGQSVNETSNYEVKRDSNGRISSIGYMEGDSFYTANFTYDNDGRVVAIHTNWLNIDTDDEGVVSDAQLMWNDKGELYQIDVTDAEGNCVNHMYEYTSYDEHGNWVVCIHKDSNGSETQESRAISYDATTAESSSSATADEAIDSGIDNALEQAVAEKQAKGKSTGEKVFNIIALILIICGAIHCVYEYYFTKLKGHTAAEFRAKRSAEGRESECSDGELTEFNELVKEIDTKYLDKVKFNDEIVLVPTKHQQMKAIKRCILRMEEIAPTRQSEVDEYNQLVEQYNAWNTRSFTGNKVYMGIAAIIGVGLCCAGLFFEGGLAMLLGSFFYYLASSRPLFMMLGRELNGKNASGSGLVGRTLAGVLGFWSAAASTKYYIRYVSKSGDKTPWERDYGEELGWFSMKSYLVLCVLVVLFFLIWIVNIVNYLRNYILYR